MLSTDRIENNNKKTALTTTLTTTAKKTTLHMQHTFFVHFFTFVVSQLQREAF